MRNINKVFIAAKEKKRYTNCLEFESMLEAVKKVDRHMKLDWDSGAGEEWARFTKSDLGVICMMNAKIGIVFARKNCLNNETIKILKSLFLVEVKDFNSKEWAIDLAILMETTPEISWNVSPYAVEAKKMSLNDLYFATI